MSFQHKICTRHMVQNITTNREAIDDPIVASARVKMSWRADVDDPQATSRATVE
jgi:hypothetical protein